jgi:hypothetical protein
MCRSAEAPAQNGRIALFTSIDTLHLPTRLVSTFFLLFFILPALLPPLVFKYNRSLGKMTYFLYPAFASNSIPSEFVVLPIILLYQ